MRSYSAPEVSHAPMEVRDRVRVRHAPMEVRARVRVRG